MASEPDREPLPQSQVDARRAQGQGRAQPGDEVETFGTVTLTRHVKDDGRALILYAHEEPERA